MAASTISRRAAPAAQADRLCVLYDGACPLCRREIAFYRRRRGADDLRWIDVSQEDPGSVAPGITRAAALKRFHVVDGAGRVITGGRAFQRLWAALPAFRAAGRLFALAPLSWLLDRAYDMFLKLRPWLQRRAGAVPQGRS